MTRFRQIGRSERAAADVVYARLLAELQDKWAKNPDHSKLVAYYESKAIWHEAYGADAIQTIDDPVSATA
jgi:hypothetical protein